MDGIVILNSDFRVQMEYQLSYTHFENLRMIEELADDGYVDLENRNLDIDEETGLRWKICDELVSINVLEEDEESFYVSYKITQLGKDLLNKYLVNS